MNISMLSSFYCGLLKIIFVWLRIASTGGAKQRVSLIKQVTITGNEANYHEFTLPAATAAN